MSHAAPPRVFISHSSRDKDRFVLEFARRLREAAIDGIGARKVCFGPRCFTKSGKLPQVKEVGPDGVGDEVLLLGEVLSVPLEFSLPLSRQLMVAVRFMLHTLADIASARCGEH